MLSFSQLTMGPGIWSPRCCSLQVSGSHGAAASKYPVPLSPLTTRRFLCQNVCTSLSGDKSKLFKERYTNMNILLPPQDHISVRKFPVKPNQQTELVCLFFWTQLLHYLGAILHIWPFHRTIGDPGRRPKKWALGKRHLSGKSWFGHLLPYREGQLIC